MQSIYGFRGANVGLFLKARLAGFNGVQLEHLQLRCNFRSDPAVVDWVNASFSAAFPAEPDVNRGRVSYTPSTAVRASTDESAVTMHAFHGEDATAQELAFVCRQIANASSNPDLRSIAVLGRSRNHLQGVIDGLQQLSVPYSAQAMESLAQSPVVADLLTLCRVLASDADRLAWMALLRAPWCGLGLADLLQIARWGETPRYTPLWQALADSALQQALTEQGRAQLEAVLPVLGRARHRRNRLGLRAWVEQVWLDLGGPATVADSGALEDAESFFQLLEQAEQEGLALDVSWLEQRVEKQYMKGGEAGSKVEIMTLHKAKGLEFDCVFIPQMARTSRGDDRELLLWDEHSGPDGERSFLLAADDHSAKGEPTLYNYLAKLRKDKSVLEGTRLLYVGATRAVRQLVLSASLKLDERSGELRAPAARSLLSPIWPSVAQQMCIHEPALIAPVQDGQAVKASLLRLHHPTKGGTRLDPLQSQVTGPNVPPRPLNYRQRCVGTVVHLALEELSRRDEIPVDIAPADRERWRAALAGAGLWGNSLKEALAAVEQSLHTTLAADGAGSWVLSNRHLQARSEWALTRVNPSTGRTEDLVIDRTFIDVDSGTRWLIDYKNSQPEPGEELADFFRRQEQDYREQLLRYRDVLRALAKEPLRCALFFTALGQLHHIEDLDLAAVESR
jgi:ATP-dependent helicase/nuclease subunit A